ALPLIEAEGVVAAVAVEVAEDEVVAVDGVGERVPHPAGHAVLEPDHPRDVFEHPGHDVRSAVAVEVADDRLAAATEAPVGDHGRRPVGVVVPEEMLEPGDDDVGGAVAVEVAGRDVARELLATRRRDRHAHELERRRRARWWWRKRWRWRGGRRCRRGRAGVAREVDAGLHPRPADEPAGESERGVRVRRETGAGEQRTTRSERRLEMRTVSSRDGAR